MSQPKCIHCGKFMQIDPTGFNKTWYGALVWDGGYVPEPSHEEYWHIDCAETNDTKTERKKSISFNAGENESDNH